MNVDKFLEENVELFSGEPILQNVYVFMPYELINFLEKFAGEICREQREICAEEYFKKHKHGTTFAVSMELITSTPEPKLERAVD